ncbi:hypothetical protein OOJ91_12140 [Micromonospora lupini]|uniref:hypothetical protein n=1 Tax=Micromonospora lupini TaxID=285679 RepID=UPI00224FB4E4|nr:hypothetical protein [Micromonospora lupini]MCX5066628.1 hypothetical protein [Micromonospora lupini]
MTTPLLPAGPLRRCRCCHRPVPSGPMYDGYGEKCAEKRGLIPRSIRLRRPKTTTDGGPGLLGFLPGAVAPEEGDPDDEPEPTLAQTCTESDEQDT